ncbi:MAG TPA: hypothetical protein VH186_10655 [Chloroflexia bacterium]|nr:hypothetical protein [Chloroflexia bacterium]
MSEENRNQTKQPQEGDVIDYSKASERGEMHYSPGYTSQDAGTNYTREGQPRTPQSSTVRKPVSEEEKNKDSSWKASPDGTQTGASDTVDVDQGQDQVPNSIPDTTRYEKY